jgi:hypothetical protein
MVITTSRLCAVLRKKFVRPSRLFWTQKAEHRSLEMVFDCQKAGMNHHGAYSWVTPSHVQLRGPRLLRIETLGW